MTNKNKRGEPYPLEIQSEYFERLRYLMKDNHVVILGRACGNLSVAMPNLRTFANELLEIADVCVLISKCTSPIAG